MRGAPPTAVDTAAVSYRENRAAMEALLRPVHDAMARVHDGGGDTYVARHRERGKLLLRERIDLLPDRDSPFLELAPLAGFGTDDAVGGGMVTGIGLIRGVECLISGNDPTV